MLEALCLSVWEAIVLGLVQGLCEFLPVSSSGHLELAERLLGMDAPGLLLDTMLHVGTLVAVCIYFWRDIWAMLRNPLGKDVRLLVVATIPAVLATLLLGDFVDVIYSGVLLGFSFILTSLVLWLGATFTGAREAMTYKDAGIMGLFQAAAILPGLSRSGSTISGGQIAGLNREKAARFSFLMSIPAIVGALVFQVKDIVTEGLPENISLLPMIVGVVVATLAGLFAITFMMRLIRKARLKWFGVYTLVLGALVLADQFFFHLFF
jgi:undecaprenyl-diphosphatase